MDLATSKRISAQSLQRAGQLDGREERRISDKIAPQSLHGLRDHNGRQAVTVSESICRRAQRERQARERLHRSATTHTRSSTEHAVQICAAGVQSPISVMPDGSVMLWMLLL